MPKIDMSAVPVLDRLVYPAGFREETAGYEQQRVGDAAGLDPVSYTHLTLPTILRV